MAIVQDTFNAAPAKGFPGMVVNGETSNRFSRTCESAAGIAFGAPVWRGAADRGCVAVQTLAAAGAADAGNAGAGAITASPAVAPPARNGAYKVVQVTGGATGAFSVYDPDGAFVGNGVVGTEFVGGGLTFTVTDPGTDPAVGDSYTVTVTGGDFLGVAIADHGIQPLPGGVAADIYPQYASVGIMGAGAIMVTVGGDVTDGAPVQVNAANEYVATGGTPVGGGWEFDETVADGGLCTVVRR